MLNNDANNDVATTSDFTSLRCRLLQDEGFSQPSPKLVPNLCNKTNYIIHYHNLNLYLELGLCLTNVHRDLSFNQSPWLKYCINFNTRQRTAARNDFEKYFFKLMNNVVFGKLFMCLFVLLCSYILINSFQAKLLSLWLFVFVYWAKVELTLNQPIYVGFATLDLLKTLMYDFHCNYIKGKYPYSTQLFTDTDFLTY